MIIEASDSSLNILIELPIIKQLSDSEVLNFIQTKSIPIFEQSNDPDDFGKHNPAPQQSGIGSQDLFETILDTEIGEYFQLDLLNESIGFKKIDQNENTSDGSIEIFAWDVENPGSEVEYEPGTTYIYMGENPLYARIDQAPTGVKSISITNEDYSINCYQTGLGEIKIEKSSSKVFY